MNFKTIGLSGQTIRASKSNSRGHMTRNFNSFQGTITRNLNSFQGNIKSSVFDPFIHDTDEGCPENFSLSKINRSFLSTIFKSSYKQVLVEHFEKVEYRYIVN